MTTAETIKALQEIQLRHPERSSTLTVYAQVGVITFMDFLYNRHLNIQEENSDQQKRAKLKLAEKWMQDPEPGEAGEEDEP